MDKDKLRPVVAFDVDGVLRVRRFTKDESPDYVEHAITFKDSEYPELFHGSPRWPEDGLYTSVDTFSKPCIDLIKELVADENVDVVWATTWQHWANKYFTEVLGLPKLPVAVVSMEENWFRSSPNWKSYQLGEGFNHRPLMWIDDNLPDRPNERLESRRLMVDVPLTKSYETNPYTGLTSEDARSIREWVKLASSVDGQWTLRNEHAVTVREEAIERADWEYKRTLELNAFEVVQARLLELYPDEERFSRVLASCGRLRSGLSVDTVAYTLKSHSLEGDPVELSGLLKINGYHFEVDSSDNDTVEFEV